VEQNNSQQLQPTESVQQHTSIQEPPLFSKHLHFPRVIMVLLVAVIAATISGVVFYYLGMSAVQNKVVIVKNPVLVRSITPTPVQQSNNIVVQTGSQNSNLKLFKAKSGISFKYPSDWTVKENITTVESTGYGPIENITVTSPKGLVVNYSDHNGGIGGGCDSNLNCPVTHTLKYQPVSIPNYETVYLVERVMKDPNDSTIQEVTAGLTDESAAVGTSKSFPYYEFIMDKSKKYLDRFTVSVNYNNQGSVTDLSQYFNTTEVQTAEQIISSLSF